MSCNCNHHGFGCRCQVMNKYFHPRPQPKHMKFLNTVKVEKFTVNAVGENCVFDNCENIPVGVSIKNSCLILSGVTTCLEPDIYYTFDIDRAVPIDFNALQVFIKAEPCGFHHLPVELEDTTVTVPLCAEPNFRFTTENLARLYQAKYKPHDEHHHAPERVERFLEVDLDLRGNIATSGDFFRDHRGGWCNREHHRYVLYMNNAGRLTLTRNTHETRRFGDFR